jgi:hypothetical protein
VLLRIRIHYSHTVPLSSSYIDTGSRPSILLRFLLSLSVLIVANQLKALHSSTLFLTLHTTSHHGKGQTCSNEGQSYDVRPTVVVLIGGSSGSADRGQLFQQVCHHWLPSLVVHLNSYCSSSYPTQRSGNDGGYPRRQNPYAQQDDNTSYEMSDVVNPSTAHLTSNMAGDSMAAFYDEVEHQGMCNSLS